ncbi:MAG: hypothetical protein AAFV96_11850, partial [Pseudomonadota bacterium]
AVPLAEGDDARFQTEVARLAPAPGKPAPGKPAPGRPAPGKPAPAAATPEATPKATPEAGPPAPSAPAAQEGRASPFEALKGLLRR